MTDLDHSPSKTAEHSRLAAADRGEAPWRRWGPYLAERAWGTVREDYTANGDAWGAFPHDHARARAYRWNEDGIAGICDDRQYLCLALALWNGADPILKERLFGLTGPEGNHGEDVKENYWYLDATPSHRYLRMRYRYPQAAYPYEALIAENAARSRDEPEFELVDTGVLDERRYFDVDVEYAKAAPDDIVMRVTAHNRGPDTAPLHVIPTLWFRNMWSWGYQSGPMGDVPSRPTITVDTYSCVAEHPAIGRYHWYVGEGEIWLTDNESNPAVFGYDAEPGKKDAFSRRLIHGDATATLEGAGTKAASVHLLDVPARSSRSVVVRLSHRQLVDPFRDAAVVLEDGKREADEFYAAIEPEGISAELADIHRQASAGLIWSKQLYAFDVAQWLDGDPSGDRPSPHRAGGRNEDWRHVNTFDVLSMPDAWEYPWFAAWDLAFHTIPFVSLDPGFGKANLKAMTREWYMHPNGQIPAYEWEFSNVNPPVFAWAARRVYADDLAITGAPDTDFLESMFHKLLLNFTWWVNRKDADDNNVFQGGFLGLDNVSVFDRSSVPGGGRVDQSDGTAWMAFYTLGMLRIALELAKDRRSYQDIATKFYEHFLSIAAALNAPHHSLWDPESGFYYDVLHLPDGSVHRLEVRSMVGLLPLIAVETVPGETLDRLPEFESRMDWYATYRPDLARFVARLDRPGPSGKMLLSTLDEARLRSVLGYMLDPDEFLAPYGIRSLSKVHADQPFEVQIGGSAFRVEYEPGEGRTAMLGGNSNWRGPIWFPLNYLIIEALREYHAYFGDAFRIEHPTGSGKLHTLAEVADDLSARLISLFTADRPYLGTDPSSPDAGHLFYEYFHGDTGEGLGASHQTGWTALVAKLIEELG